MVLNGLGFLFHRGKAKLMPKNKATWFLASLISLALWAAASW